MLQMSHSSGDYMLKIKNYNWTAVAADLNKIDFVTAWQCFSLQLDNSFLHVRCLTFGGNGFSKSLLMAMMCAVLPLMMFPDGVSSVTDCLPDSR